MGAAAAQGGPERFFRGGEAVRDQAPKLRPLDHFVLPDCKQSGPPREFVAGEPFVYIFNCVDALPQVEIGSKAPNRPASRFPSLRMDWIAAAMTGSELRIDPLPPPEEGVSLKVFKNSLAWQKRAMLEYCSDFLASREPTMRIETDKRLAKYN